MMLQSKRQIIVMIAIVSVLTFDTSISAEPDFPRYSMGSDFDAQRYMSIPKGAPLSRGDYLNLPSAASLRNLAPPAGHQGQSGSCVGWATAYSAATIASNFARGNTSTSPSSIPARSPAFIFNQIKLSEDCGGGSYTPDALKVLTYRGVPGIDTFPYSDTRCHQAPSQAHLKQASQHRIRDFIRLGSTTSRRALHIEIRKALAQSQPVVIGMTVGDTFQRHRGTQPVAFTRQDLEALGRYGVTGLAGQYEQGWGGHAMTVIAYDDRRDGGAFLIMNSWGQDWGDQGHAWVRYGDFNQWVFEAYAVVPMEPAQPKPEVLTPNYRNQIVMKDAHDNVLPLFAQAAGRYQLGKSLYSGSLLRTEIQVSENVYVYIVGTDATADRHTLLFPNVGVTNPLIPARNTMLLPGPTEDYYARLDDNPGKDYFIVIQSREKLDTQQLVDDLDFHARHPLEDRFKLIFGDRLAPVATVKRSPKGQTVAYLGERGILVDTIEIDHLPGQALDHDNTPPRIVIVEPGIDQADRVADGETPVRYMTGDELILKGLAQDEHPITGIEIDGASDLKFSSRGPFIARLDISQIPIGQTRDIWISAVDANDNRTTRKWTFKRVRTQD